MASTLANIKKNLKRAESRKSHSWWWDSHINPKNSKWLSENLEEMDKSVKRMLKLIEEDGDSFAKKAEMYYQKRPELISHVEEFYRMYRSLAERYDHVTGELRKNIPSDLQSQGSCISDIGSEPVSTWPSPDQRPSRRRSSHRAAGFDFFLGSGGSNFDLYNKEGDEMSSSLDSESESDDSSVNNYSALQSLNPDDLGRRRKIIELEVELREVKEKLRMQEVEDAGGSSKEAKNGNSEDPLARFAGYEEELRVAREKIRLSEEEIVRLKIELQKYGSLEFTNGFQAKLESTERDFKTDRDELESEENQGCELQERIVGLEAEVSGPDYKIQALVEELRITKERLQDSEKEIASLRQELDSNKSSETISHLQDQLEMAQKDLAMWKAKLNTEKREVSKLQERIGRYKTNLSDREYEIRELKVGISEAEQNTSLERTQLQVKISKLLEERNHLEEKIKELELHSHILEEEIRQVKDEKPERKCMHEAMEKSLNGEIERLRADIADRSSSVEDLNKKLDALKLKHDILITERDELNAKVLTLNAEVSSRDDWMDQMDKRLHQLHIEQAELITGTEGARKLVGELRSRVKDLENEIESQRVVIAEGAEEKREAIRQLCFSLEHYRNGYEHYRNGYHQLRQAFTGHKRPAVLAS